MEAYSMDLRVRILDAVQSRGDTGESIVEIADRFGVSRQWIYLLVRRWGEERTAAPKPHGGGQPRKVDEQLEAKLRAVLEDRPDTTLEELRDHLGIAASLMCIWRALRRLKITWKKKAPSQGARRGPGRARAPRMERESA